MFFVGEVGLDRHEFLYELKNWELRMIMRGYQARSHKLWEMSRLMAYSSAHCMGAKNAKPLTQWLPFWWEKDISPYDQPDDKEVERLRQLMRDENERLKKKSAGE